jgi:hypothetical protein
MLWIIDGEIDETLSEQWYHGCRRDGRKLATAEYNKTIM